MIGRISGLMSVALATAVVFLPQQAFAQSAQIKRGLYLVNIGGCNDCHTPGSFLGKRDTTRTLAGSDVGFGIPGMGVFVGPNLTPDKETGLGNWTNEQIVTAIRTGKRPDGRMLAPVMPYNDFAALTKEDALTIAAYLKSLPAISNKVPGPFGPADKPDVFVMTVLPAPVYNGLPPPPSGK
jgi:mono/diheme cytochrome c family protein